MENNEAQIVEILSTNLVDAFKKNYSFLYDKQVFVYGSGIYGNALVKKMRELNCVNNICAYINDFEHGFELNGIPVKSFEDCDFSGNYYIVVAMENQTAVVKKLKANNLRFYAPSKQQYLIDINLFWNRSAIYKLTERVKYYQNNMLHLEPCLLDFYNDEESKRVIQSRINFYNSGNLDYLFSYPVNNSLYFGSEALLLSDNEVLIDCGAFTGDTVEEFVNYTNGRYKKIISFEPDSHNFERLKQSTALYHDVNLFPFATGNNNCEVCFSEKSDLSSSVCESGENKVRMVRLDDFINDVPTVIKMDIEGAELDSLKGAESLIKTYRPKLAICIYHKVEDLYTIPSYLKQIVPEYRMKVRQQSSDIYETVLYAEV